MGSETSDSSSDYPNLRCPFCTKIFDEKAEVGRGPFCHDNFVSDKQIENHIDNRH